MSGIPQNQMRIDSNAELEKIIKVYTNGLTIDDITPQLLQTIKDQIKQQLTLVQIQMKVKEFIQSNQLKKNAIDSQKRQLKNQRVQINFKTFQAQSQNNIQVQQKQSFRSIEEDNAQSAPATSGFFMNQPIKQISKISQQKRTSSYSFRSKRKVKPTQYLESCQNVTIQQQFLNLQSINTQCHFSLDNKSKKSIYKNSLYIHQNTQWFYNQYFYPNYDKPFFKTQQFKRLLIELDIDYKNLTYKDHRNIRKAFENKPKLFNEQFINEELNNLNQSRKNIRNLIRQRQREIRQDRYRDDVVQLTANRSVIALHPICGHLHQGSILAIYKQNQHVIKFNKPELGTQKVLDIFISSQNYGLSRQIINPKIDMSIQPPLNDVIYNIDHEVMGIAIKLLEFKNQLILKLKEYNNQAEAIKQQGLKYDYNFLEQYGWIGTTINILSMGLKHIIARFRLRGLHPGNQQQVGKNFTSLLLNPLNLMGRQLQSSGENNDKKSAQRVWDIISDQKQVSINQTIEKLLSKYRNNLSQHIKIPEQRQKIERLIKCCTGILATLRFQGKQFKFEQNQYLIGLQEATNQDHNEYFNQIYDKLHKIVKKIQD